MNSIDNVLDWFARLNNLLDWCGRFIIKELWRCEKRDRVGRFKSIRRHQLSYRYECCRPWPKGRLGKGLSTDSRRFVALDSLATRAVIKPKTRKLRKGESKNWSFRKAMPGVTKKSS